MNGQHSLSTCMTIGAPLQFSLAHFAPNMSHQLHLLDLVARRETSIGDMADACKTCSNNPSPRSPATTTQPSTPSMHHSTKQQRDHRGRFARKRSKTTPVCRRHNVQAEEAPWMFLGIPDIPPGFTEADAA